MNNLKTNNRFSVEFPEFLGIPNNAIKSVDYPEFCNNNGWSNITMKFYDPVDKSASRGVYKLAEHLWCNENKEPLCFKIHNLDSTGMIIETWQVEINNIVHVDFGGNSSLKNTNSKIITLTISTFNCKLIL